MHARHSVIAIVINSFVDSSLGLLLGRTDVGCELVLVHGALGHQDIFVRSQGMLEVFVHADTESLVVDELAHLNGAHAEDGH